MRKLYNYLKKVTCLNYIKKSNNEEMVITNQFSPRLTRSRSESILNNETKEVNDNLQIKSQNIACRRSKRKPLEVSSILGCRGSLGSSSSLRTPKRGIIGKKMQTPRNELQVPAKSFSLKSPPIETLSADTPTRSATFHKEITHAANSHHRVLGKGSFGTIIQATYKGQLVAAKIIPPVGRNSLSNELNNFLLWHPNIVKTLRIIVNEEPQFCGIVIMEMCSSFTLEHLYNENSNLLDEKSIVRFMTDVGYALDYCHNQKVLHLDVKPQNILVNLATNVCKLCDFGNSCLLMEEDLPDNKTSVRSAVYTAPELLAGDKPTDKSDVYSFGITLWQLLNEDKTYPVGSKIDSYGSIYKSMKQKGRPPKKSKNVRVLQNLHTKCWDRDPNIRPTMKEVVNVLESVKTA